MFSTSYDEKASLSNPNSHTHSRNTSSTSKTSETSSTSSISSTASSSHRNGAPPPYTYIFYNTICEKPLPPLPPTALYSNTSFEGDGRVRFALEKPLPPLPVEEGDDETDCRIGDMARKRRSGSSARMGECAWWAKEVGESGSESEGHGEFGREKGMKGCFG